MKNVRASEAYKKHCEVESGVRHPNKIRLFLKPKINFKCRSYTEMVRTKFQVGKSYTDIVNHFDIFTGTPLYKQAITYCNINVMIEIYGLKFAPRIYSHNRKKKYRNSRLTITITITWADNQVAF